MRKEELNPGEERYATKTMCNQSVEPGFLGRPKQLLSSVLEEGSVSCSKYTCADTFSTSGEHARLTRLPMLSHFNASWWSWYQFFHTYTRLHIRKNKCRKTRIEFLTLMLNNSWKKKYSSSYFLKVQSVVGHVTNIATVNNTYTMKKSGLKSFGTLIEFSIINFIGNVVFIMRSPQFL